MYPSEIPGQGLHRVTLPVWRLMLRDINCQRAEVLISAAVLNRFMALGMPAAEASG